MLVVGAYEGQKREKTNPHGMVPSGSLLLPAEDTKDIPASLAFLRIAWS